MFRKVSISARGKILNHGVLYVFHPYQSSVTQFYLIARKRRALEMRHYMEEKKLQKVLRGII